MSEQTEVSRAEAETAKVLRLAEHLASEAGLPHRCELVALPEDARTSAEAAWPEDRGRCIRPAVALRWSDGFADAVCADERHQSGGLILVPRRHDGTTAPLPAGTPCEVIP